MNIEAPVFFPSCPDSEGLGSLQEAPRMMQIQLEPPVRRGEIGV